MAEVVIKAKTLELLGRAESNATSLRHNFMETKLAEGASIGGLKRVWRQLKGRRVYLQRLIGNRLAILLLLLAFSIRHLRFKFGCRLLLNVGLQLMDPVKESPWFGSDRLEGRPRMLMAQSICQGWGANLCNGTLDSLRNLGIRRPPKQNKLAPLSGLLRREPPTTKQNTRRIAAQQHAA